MSSARDTFLKNAGWHDAAATPVDGDLSARQYSRLTRGGSTSVLMECVSDGDTSLPAFVRMTKWLHRLGLSVPELYAVDTATGFALLEDFGDAKLTSLISQNPSCQKAHYETILDILIAIRNAPTPQLGTLSAREFCEATKLADEWYPGASSSRLDAFRLVLEPVLQETLAIQPTVSLRDFHADNIIWLPDRTPIRRPGLLDYQDAFLTHPAYDLMSLLTDARTDVTPSLRDEIIEIYAKKSGDSPSSLKQAVAVLGAQRSLRILGIFSRAAKSAGKPQHLSALPRVYRYLMECCEHPALAPVAADLAAALPTPTPAVLESLAS